MKKCGGCQKVFDTIPDHARKMDDGSALSGYYFECDCKTTFFIPLGAPYLTKMLIPPCEECGEKEECKDSCGCQECIENREAEKDREFDEKCALGYQR